MNKIHLILVFCIILTIISSGSSQSFEEQQLRFPRVRNSYSEKESTVKALFDSAHILFPPNKIYIRIHKLEQELELWASENPDGLFKLVTRYSFCTSSGRLGPKRQQGDYQIPEGFYYIDRFNPSSNFYLSLGINYPNVSDKILGNKERLGGDIFIHGNCVTIGCIPITDDKIKELYIMAVKAKSSGQLKIPVHIFPYNFANQETKNYINKLPYYNKNIPFWDDLERGHVLFETSHKLPQVKVDRMDGHYRIKKNESTTD